MLYCNNFKLFSQSKKHYCGLCPVTFHLSSFFDCKDKLYLEVLRMHESPEELGVMPMRHPLLHGRLQVRSQLLKLDGGRRRKENGHLE